MPLTVLSDNDVRAVLNTITKQDVLDIHRALAIALYQYSTMNDSESSDCAATNQPSRIAIKGKDGSTTLFMPASSDSAIGVKIISITESSKTTASDTKLPDVSSLEYSGSSLDIMSKQPSGSPSSSVSIMQNSTPLSSIPSSSPSISASGTSTRTSMDHDHPLDTQLPTTSPRGSVTLLSETGQPRALINASTLTAFRTALVSTMLFKFRHSVHNITIFGAGLQAFWHLFICLLLRGNEILHINVINRDFSRAHQLLMSLGQTKNDVVSSMMHSTKLRPSILTSDHVEYVRLLKEHVREADAIFCTTPATSPLFPASYLTHSEGRRKARYIAAIGSYKPHMQELHEDILHQAVRKPDEQHHHAIHMHHRHAQEGGAIVVDSIEGAMREAGDIIKAEISSHDVVELGELAMLKINASTRARNEEQAETGETAKKQPQRHGLGQLLPGKKSKDQQQKMQDPDGGLTQWLQRGNVIYKGVGIGLMDVVVGMEVVRLAEERGIGTFVADF